MPPLKSEPWQLAQIRSKISAPDASAGGRSLHEVNTEAAKSKIRKLPNRFAIRGNPRRDAQPVS